MRAAHLLVATLIPLVSVACLDGDEHEDGALFEQAYEEGLQEPKADGYDCSGVRVPDRSGFNKRIALTFDDGPNPATTPQVMAVLRRHQAPATFFINGKRINGPAARDLAAEIAADPAFLLANHSQSHNNFTQISHAQALRDIDDTSALIRAAGATPRYFRFPYGAATCEAKRAAEDRGYAVTGWHIDSADWCYAAGGGTCKKSTFKYVPDEMRNDMTAYVLSQLRSSNGGILLFHDVHQPTADALDGLLTQLEAAGYSFARLDDETLFPKLHGLTPPPARFIGDACQTAADCAFTSNGQTGRCHPAGFCTVACAGSCDDLDGRAGTFCMADDQTADAGMCVSRAQTINGRCLSLPGTAAEVHDRFVGTSGASAATALVCAPR